MNPEWGQDEQSMGVTGHSQHCHTRCPIWRFLCLCSKSSAALPPWLQNTSLICKMFLFFACSSISMSCPMREQWSSFQACSAKADFSTSLHLVLAWCFLRQVPSILLVSPMYTFSQLLHRVLCTTPALLGNGSTSLTFVSCFWSVEVVVNMKSGQCSLPSPHSDNSQRSKTYFVCVDYTRVMHDCCMLLCIMFYSHLYSWSRKFVL